MKSQPQTIAEVFETASLGAPENAIGFVLWRLAARYQRQADRALTPLGVTNLQFVVLALVGWLGRSGDSVTQIELAQFGGIHPMQVSQTLKMLERKKLVKRRRSNSDTRAKQLQLTRTGLKTLHHALPIVIEVQSRLFGEAGRPGGSLLSTLLLLEKKQVSAMAE